MRTRQTADQALRHFIRATETARSVIGEADPKLREIKTLAAKEAWELGMDAQLFAGNSLTLRDIKVRIAVLLYEETLRRSGNSVSEARRMIDSLFRRIGLAGGINWRGWHRWINVERDRAKRVPVGYCIPSISYLNHLRAYGKEIQSDEFWRRVFLTLRPYHY